MNQSDTVGVLERGKSFLEEALGLLDGKGPMALHHLPEVRARHVFHRIPRESGATHDVVDAHDVRMAQPSGKLRFATEPLQHAWIGGE